MALQALGAYSEKAYSPTFNLTIKVSNGGDSHQFVVNQQNAVVLQSYEVFTEVLRFLKMDHFQLCAYI